MGAGSHRKKWMSGTSNLPTHTHTLVSLKWLLGFILRNTHPFSSGHPIVATMLQQQCRVVLRGELWLSWYFRNRNCSKKGSTWLNYFLTLKYTYFPLIDPTFSRTLVSLNSFSSSSATGSSTKFSKVETRTKVAMCRYYKKILRL